MNFIYTGVKYIGGSKVQSSIGKQECFLGETVSSIFLDFLEFEFSHLPNSG